MTPSELAAKLRQQEERGDPPVRALSVVSRLEMISLLDRLAALDRAAGPPPAPTYTREGKGWRADGFPVFRSTEAAGPVGGGERTTTQARIDAAIDAIDDLVSGWQGNLDETLDNVRLILWGLMKETPR